jgi:hypothetical protein
MLAPSPRHSAPLRKFWHLIQRRNLPVMKNPSLCVLHLRKSLSRCNNYCLNQCTKKEFAKCQQQCLAVAGGWLVPTHALQGLSPPMPRSELSEVWGSPPIMKSLIRKIKMTIASSLKVTTTLLIPISLHLQPFLAGRLNTVLNLEDLDFQRFLNPMVLGRFYPCPQ